MTKRDHVPPEEDRLRSQQTASPQGIPPGRLVGLGMEFAVLILVASGIGHLVDRYVFHSAQAWGLIIGCLLGFVLGMVRVVGASRQN